MLSDEEASRIDAGLRGADRATLERWVREPLADRRARSSLLLGQTRSIAPTAIHARTRSSALSAFRAGEPRHAVIPCGILYHAAAGEAVVGFKRRTE